MGNMRFKVGDRVRIKSIAWYNENKTTYGNVLFDNAVFVKEQSLYCGCVLTIRLVTNNSYYVIENNYYWSDEMIEGLAEEETKPNIIEEAKTYWDSVKDAWICSDGYQFVDENGNVINATKIVLEKKKKEYPKTYEECYKIMGVKLSDCYIQGYKSPLLEDLQELLICRDAYWKIAGEEMGLGKPWEPSRNEDCFVISRSCGEVYLYSSAGGCDTFEFPIEEMRDAFYENFKKEIEECKELL